MNRRTFLKITGSGFIAGALSGVPRVKAREGKKPNILFIMIDDLGKEWISCYGAEDIQTPNIDALAKTGMRFENAYSMPQCTPSRATLLTGQYPWRTGWVNHWDVPRWGVGYFDWKQRSNMTFARILQQAGYATAAAGKWQINDFRIAPDAMKKHGFDDCCMWTGYETGNPASGERYWDAYIHTSKGGSKTYSGKYGPDVYADFLIQFMKAHCEQPMMLYFPMALTHSPLTNTPAEMEVKTPLDKHKVMVRYTDILVGRIVNALDEIHIRDRTIVIFTTDNGSGGRITADFTDILPTFAELGGAHIPEDLIIDGVSIAPLLLGKTKDSPRKWIMALGHGPARLDAKGVRGKADYAERVIRDKRYKVWINEERKIDRLYDLQKDPFEKKNLIASTRPEHRAALLQFQAVVDIMPERDARPRYEPRKPNPWDKKPGKGS